MFNTINAEDKANAIAQLLIHRPGEWYTFGKNKNGRTTIHTSLISSVDDDRINIYFSNTYYTIDKETHEELREILKKYNYDPQSKKM